MKINNHDMNRRTVLRSIFGSGLASVLPGSAVGQRAPEKVIGDFESGLDGWSGPDPSRLSRTNRSDKPWSVSSGEHALLVNSGGLAEPRLEKSLHRIPTRYVLADVTVPPSITMDQAGSGESESTYEYLTVQLSLLSRRTGGIGVCDLDRENGHANEFGVESGDLTMSGGDEGENYGEDNGNSRLHEVFVSERDVPIGYSGTLGWNLEAVGDASIDNIEKIVFSWERTSTHSAGGQEPQQTTETTRRYITWDNIRFSESRNQVQVSKIDNVENHLRTRHGEYRYEFEGLEDGKERGTLVFEDGFRIPIETSLLPEGGYQVTIGDETYELTSNEP